MMTKMSSSATDYTIFYEENQIPNPLTKIYEDNLLNIFLFYKWENFIN